MGIESWQDMAEEHFRHVIWEVKHGNLQAWAAYSAFHSWIMWKIEQKYLKKDSDEENKMNLISLSSELKRKLGDEEIMRISKAFPIAQRKVQKLWLIAFFRT